MRLHLSVRSLNSKRLPIKIVLFLISSVLIEPDHCILYPIEIGIGKVKTNGDLLIHVDESKFVIKSITQQYVKMTVKLTQGPQYCPVILIEVNGVDYDAFPIIGHKKIVQPDQRNAELLNRIRFEDERSDCNCKVNQIQEQQKTGEGYNYRLNNQKCAYLISYKEVPGRKIATDLKIVAFDDVENLAFLLATGTFKVFEEAYFEQYFEVRRGSYDNNFTMTVIDKAPAGKVTVLMFGRDLFQMGQDMAYPENIYYPTLKTEECSEREETEKTLTNKLGWTFIGLSIVMGILLIFALAVICYYRRMVQVLRNNKNGRGHYEAPRQLQPTIGEDNNNEPRYCF